MSEPADNRTKLEREIDEILTRTDAPIPITAKARSTRWRIRRWMRSVPAQLVWLRTIDSFWGWLLIAAAVYLLGAWLTDQHGIGWQMVRVVGLIGLGMAIFRIVRPRYRSGGKIWRGQVQDMNKRGVQLGDRFDDWKKRR